MIWNEEKSVLTFLSRTTSRVHAQLVKRIFRDSQQEFVRTDYTVLKDESVDSLDENKVKDGAESDGFTRVVDKKVIKRDNKQTVNVRDKTKYNKNKKTESSGDKPLIRGKK